MARKSVTKEDVARASQTLRDRGDRVTLMAVRQELGCGSFTTLKPLIAEVAETRLQIEREGCRQQVLAAGVDITF